MNGGEDEPAPEKDKKTQNELNTARGSSSTGVTREQDGRRVVSVLPTAPVIADAGTTQPIEGTAQPGQILPFESQVQGHIGRQLRALYDHVLDQPIPDRLLTLLKQLDEGQASGARGTVTGAPLQNDDPSDPKGDV
jgi:hypothetical protein